MRESSPRTPRTHTSPRRQISHVQYQHGIVLKRGVRHRCGIAGGGGYSDNNHDLRRNFRFQRVVKVIFKEASDEHVLRQTLAVGSGNGSMEWT